MSRSIHRYMPTMLPYTPKWVLVTPTRTQRRRATPLSVRKMLLRVSLLYDSRFHFIEDSEWAPPATYIVTPRPELQHTRSRSNSVSSKAPSTRSIPGFKRLFGRRQHPHPEMPQPPEMPSGPLIQAEKAPVEPPKRKPPPPRPTRPVPKFNIPPPPPIPQSELASKGAGPSRPPALRRGDSNARPGTPIRVGSAISLGRSASTASSKPGSRRVGFAGNHRLSRRMTPAFDPRSSTYRFIHSTINFADPQLPDLNFLDGVVFPSREDFEDENENGEDGDVEERRSPIPEPIPAGKPSKGHGRGRSLFSLKRSLSNGTKTSWFGFRSLDAKEWSKLKKQKQAMGEDITEMEQAERMSGGSQHVVTTGPTPIPGIAVTQASGDSETSEFENPRPPPQPPVRPPVRPRRSNSNASAHSVADLMAKKPPFAMRRPLHQSGSSASLLAAIASDPGPIEESARDGPRNEDGQFVGGFKPEPSQKMLIDLFEKLRKKQLESEGATGTPVSAHRVARTQSPLAMGGPMSPEFFVMAKSYTNTGKVITDSESAFFKGSAPPGENLSQAASPTASRRSGGSGDEGVFYESPDEAEFPLNPPDNAAYEQTTHPDTPPAIEHSLPGPPGSSRTPADDDGWSEEEEEDDEEGESLRATIAQHLLRQQISPSYNAATQKTPVAGPSTKPTLPALQPTRPPPPPPRPSLHVRSRSAPALPAEALPAAMPRMPQNYARPIAPGSYSQQPSDQDTSDAPPVPSTPPRLSRSRSKDTPNMYRKNRSKSKGGSTPVRSPTPPMPRFAGPSASEDERSSSDTQRMPAPAHSMRSVPGYDASEMQVPRATKRRSVSNPSPELALAAALDTAAPVFSTVNLSRLSRISSSSSDLDDLPLSDLKERKQIVSVVSRPRTSLPEVPGVPGHVLVELAGTFEATPSNYRVSNLASSTVASSSHRALDKSNSGSSLESRSDGPGLNERSREDFSRSMSESEQSPPPEYRPRTSPAHVVEMYPSSKTGHHVRPSGRTTPDLGFGAYRVPFTKPPLPVRVPTPPDGRVVPIVPDSKPNPRFNPAARISPGLMGRTSSPASTIRA
ncbi:hypothetical protein FRB93_010266 [Tulasnella sp. JGI-2019a]|nr:hypothetical protein FRB93_010266 [Tulasnella sp. JGI-2019a]